MPASSSPHPTRPRPSAPTATDVAHEARHAVRTRRHVVIATAIGICVLLLCVTAAALVLFLLLPMRQRSPPVPPPGLRSGATVSPTACNPLCSPIFQSCRVDTTPPASSGTPWGGTRCVNNCGFTSLPMNTMCVGSTTVDVCLLNVPTGTGTAVILQSQLPGPNGLTYALTAKPSASGALTRAAPTLVLEEARLDNYYQYFTLLSTSVNMCTPTSAACTPSAEDVCPCNCEAWPNDYHVGKFGSSKVPLMCPVPGASPAVGSTVNAFADCGSPSDTIMAPCKNSYKVLVTAQQNPAGPGWALRAAPTVSAAAAAPVALVAQEPATWRELPGTQAHMFVPFRDNNAKTGAAPSSGVWLTDVSFDRCERNRTAVLTAVPPPAASAAPPTLQWYGNAFPSGINTDTSALTPGDGWNVIPVNMTQEFYIRHSCKAGTRIPPPSFTSTKVSKDVSTEARVWGDYDACTGKQVTTM